MSLLRVFLFFPGYVFLAFLFFLPTEWGKDRNVALSGRQWRARKYFAPLHSVWIYGALWLFRLQILGFMVGLELLDYETALKLMGTSS